MYYLHTVAVYCLLFVRRAGYMLMNVVCRSTDTKYRYSAANNRGKPVQYCERYFNIEVREIEGRVNVSKNIPTT